MKWGLPFSPSILVWVTIGFLRYWNDKDRRAARSRQGQLHTFKQFPHKTFPQVGVLLPCFNEEVVVLRAIESLKQSVEAKQIFVISDGSTDQTANIAREAGCNVLELAVGRGKAQALEEGLAYFQLLDRFQYIVMADADATFSPHFVRHAVSIFTNNPDVAAIAGYAQTRWYKHLRPRTEMFFIGYRARLYRLYQLLLTYGWTWKYINVCPVIPGFASVYRSDVLRQLKIHVPGMAIEDFNLAFQVHKKKLGRIAHHPAVYAVDQDPNNLRDYVRQIERWNVGFWQTVRHNGFWPSLFWLTQGLFMIETLIFYLSLLFLPVIVIVLTELRSGSAVPEVVLAGITLSSFEVFILSIYFGFFVMDYLMTFFVAVLDRRYMLAFYGLGFTFLRIIDALVLLFSLPAAWRKYSSGRWQPPTRYQEKKVATG